MLKINKLIKDLYILTGNYLIKSNEVTNKIDGDFYTYHIITSEINDAIHEIGIKEIGDTKHREYVKQYQSTISFNSISTNEEIAYDMAVKLKDIFDVVYKEHIEFNHDVAILETTSLKDVSVRLVDNNEYRFNFDVRVRFSRLLSERVESIDGATVNVEMKGV